MLARSSTYSRLTPLLVVALTFSSLTKASDEKQGAAIESLKAAIDDMKAAQAAAVLLPPAALTISATIAEDDGGGGGGADGAGVPEPPARKQRRASSVVARTVLKAEGDAMRPKIEEYERRRRRFLSLAFLLTYDSQCLSTRFHSHLLLYL